MQELLKQIGRPYEMFNEDQTYQGCFFPVQLLYPHLPKYKLRSMDDDKNYYYGLSKLQKHCIMIERSQLKQGDIIATRFRDELHVAIYYEYNKVIEVFKGHSLQIGRIDKFKENIICFRIP